MSAEVIINGRRIPLSKREVKDLKGITIGDKIGFEFFDGAFQEMNLLFVRPKPDYTAPTRWGQGRLLAEVAQIRFPSDANRIGVCGKQEKTYPFNPSCTILVTLPSSSSIVGKYECDGY